MRAAERYGDTDPLLMDTIAKTASFVAFTRTRLKAFMMCKNAVNCSPFDPPPPPPPRPPQNRQPQHRPPVCHGPNCRSECHNCHHSGVDPGQGRPQISNAPPHSHTQSTVSFPEAMVIPTPEVYQNPSGPDVQTPFAGNAPHPFAGARGQYPQTQPQQQDLYGHGHSAPSRYHTMPVTSEYIASRQANPGPHTHQFTQNGYYPQYDAQRRPPGY